MNIASNKVKINPSSSDELSTQILPEDTPLIFQWLPKSLGISVPNNAKYPYMQRLVNWAEREPQRKIYLVVNGEGFKEGQIEKLREDLKPASNIQVVDYQQVSKEVGFEHLTVPNRSNSESFKLSALLVQIYDQQSKVAKILHFADFLDAMRLEIVLNIEKITSRKDAIYFDFDILPKDGQQIGPVSIPGDILLSSEADIDNSDLLEDRDLENSIIGVNSRSQNIIKNMCKYVEQEFHYYRYIGCHIPKGEVYGAMKSLMKLLYHQEHNKYSMDAVLGNVQNLEEYKKALHTSGSVLDVPSEWYGKFRFEKNCKNVEITSDKTWENRGVIKYDIEVLPLNFNNLPDQTITASMPKETIESLPSNELPEDLCSVDGDYCSPYEVCHPNE